MARRCGRRDLNPHILRCQNLNLVRLPIPPRPRADHYRSLRPRMRRWCCCRRRGTQVASLAGVPPTDDELMRAFLDGSPFVFTGPERWNALGLGTTAVFASSLVYNTKRTGTFVLGGRRFLLRRVRFPASPSPEWFAVDLFEHANQVAASREDLTASLTRALERGTLSRERLREMSREYATQATQAFIGSLSASPRTSISR